MIGKSQNYITTFYGKWTTVFLKTFKITHFAIGNINYEFFCLPVKR